VTETPLGPPTPVGTTTATGTTATLDIPLPAGVKKDDLLIAVVAHATNGVTVTAPSGWTQVGTTSTGNHTFAVFLLVATADMPGQLLTWTWSAAGNTVGVISAFRGQDTSVSGGVYASALTSGTVTFADTPAVNAPDMAWLLTGWTVDASVTSTPQAGFGLDLASAANGTLNIRLVAYQAKTAATGLTRRATNNASTNTGMLALTFGSPRIVASDALRRVGEHGLTIHALVRPSSITASSIIRKNQTWGLRLTAAGKLEYVYTDGGGTFRSGLLSTATLSAGADHQCIVSDDGTSTVTFWVNGTKNTVSRTGTAGFTQGTDNVTLAHRYDGTTRSDWFPGRLDEVAVFAAPFTDDMVAAYTAAWSTGTFGTALATSSLPRLKVEVAWRSDPTWDSQSWTDMTAYVRPTMQLQRSSRRDELDRFEPGRATLEVDSRNGKLDPDNTSGPWYPIRPYRAVRVRCQYGTDTAVSARFYGLLEPWQLRRATAGVDETATLEATDLLGAFAAEKITEQLVRPEETTGSRVKALLRPRRIIADAGKSTLPADSLEGAQRLDTAITIAQTEGGILYATPDGRLRFRDRHHRQYDTTIRLTVQSGQTKAARHWEPELDRDRLYTAVRVTPSSGEAQTAENTTATDTYMRRTLDVATIHATNLEAKAMADWLVAQYSQPVVRIPTLRLVPQADPSMWTTVLPLDISQRVRLIESTGVQRDFFIEGVRETWGADRVEIELQLSPTLLEPEAWRLGTSKLGSTTRLHW